MMGEVAFLSLRVPKETKRVIKQIAARKGSSIQDLIGGLVDDFVARENRATPSLAAAVNKLRDKKAKLMKLGVSHIDIFGSIVRDEAHHGSDIDLVVDFNQKQMMSLSKFVSLKNTLEDILGYNVDLAEKKMLKPEVKSEFQRDALRVF